MLPDVQLPPVELLLLVHEPPGDGLQVILAGLLVIPHDKVVVWPLLTRAGLAVKEQLGERLMEAVLEQVSAVQLSVTETSAVLYGPADVGVQLIVPVDELILDAVQPAGRAELVKLPAFVRLAALQLQVYGGVPPVAANVAVQGELAVIRGKEVAVIVGWVQEPKKFPIKLVMYPNCAAAPVPSVKPTFTWFIAEGSVKQ